MSGWWDELAAIAEAAGCDRHSAAWYRSMRDQYMIRFPNADERSKDNMRMFVKHAEAREDPTRCPGDILCAEGRCEWPKCAAAAAINTWCEACGARYGEGHDEWHAANS